MASEAASFDDEAARRFRAALLLITGLGLWIRLWAAAAVSIGYDEFWHIFIARNLPREIRSLAHPPLFILLLRAGDALWSSPWSYRAVSVLSGAAVVASFGHLLRKIGASAPLALLGALGAAVGGSLVLLSVVVEAYMLCAAFVLIAFSFLLDLLAPAPSARSRAGFAIFACLALCSHYAAGLFLAAAVLATLLLRSGAPGVWRSRWKADLATIALPIATGGALYIFLARPWVRALNHLPTFYFDAARETAPEFLLRNLAATAAILVPLSGSELLRAALLVLFVAAALILAASSIAEPARRAGRRAPAAVLLMLLLLGMVGGLFGKYPFGGMMRHQMLLLLFAPLAAWTALDTVRTRARSPAGRALALALALAAVGVSATATARHIARARHVTWPGVAEMERDFGAEAAIHVDQFNLIGFFMSAHDWRWSYRGPLGPPGVEAYLLTRDGRSRTLIAHRERWNADPYEPGLYRDIATASHVAGAPCGVLFVARQQPFDVPPSAEQMRLLSRAAGLELGRTQLTRSLVLGRLCAGDTPASGGPRVDRVVPAFAKAGVPFQVQPDGYSALSIEGAGFRPGAVVVLAGRPLTTVFGNSGWITATVPPELTQRPGRLELRVVDPERGPSAAASFEVRP